MRLSYGHGYSAIRKYGTFRVDPLKKKGSNSVEPREETDQLASTGNRNDAQQPAASTDGDKAGPVAPQECPTCGAVPATNGGADATPSYVYAIGRIEPRFPQHLGGEGIRSSHRQGRDAGPH